MATWDRDVRRSSLAFGARRVAERSAALESLTSFSETQPDPQSAIEPEGEGVADRAAKAAARARGGDQGWLIFPTVGERTFVAHRAP